MQSVIMTSLPTSLALMAALFTLYTAFSMPCLYRFGVEKGRTVQMMLMIVFMAMAGGVSALTAERGVSALSHIGPAVLLLGILLASLALLIASYFISVKWYRYTPNL